MTYDLYIAARLHSSWSLRGWLMFARFGLPVRTQLLDIYGPGKDAAFAPLAPARLVPVIRTPSGTVLGDTLAIAETLAERHPDAGLWPSDPARRALARWLVAEMHSGFQALRSNCPMDLRHVYDAPPATEAVRADLARLEELWAMTPGPGPWLFGDYSLADAFYAPVATRIVTWSLPVSDRARAYVEAHLACPAFRQWRAEGLAESTRITRYDTDLPTRPWPG
ncbi:glutathione S-transferase [Histidinibacterium lentulum]|uniref:Glutathione S-transferase n=1 Tax=Histidinibacterium lentulum TaxID=2480588 RepID=A0A3N2R895_9RHOB|nr:glutathione S-transferase [Histidinibacterium lentulum]ROU03674.1 glutathione S-transferase [Histidinibacterium lentulum]